MDRIRGCCMEMKYFSLLIIYLASCDKRLKN